MSKIIVQTFILIPLNQSES